GAHHKPGAEPIFQPGNELADRGRRPFQLAACGREAFQLRGKDEDLHFSSTIVHGLTCDFNSQMIIRLCSYTGKGRETILRAPNDFPSSQGLTGQGYPMPLALYALTAGAFGIGVTEFVIMGLLIDVSKDLGVSIPAAGLLISGYALGVVAGAPILGAISGKWSRKTLLMALMV